jgi:hypothetical protein
VKAIPDQTVAFDAKCNHTRTLYLRNAPRFGHTVWAHSWAQTARFSIDLFRNRHENTTRRWFS